MDAPGCLGAFQFLRNVLQAGGTCRLIALCCRMQHATMKRRCPRCNSNSSPSLPAVENKQMGSSEAATQRLRLD